MRDPLLYRNQSTVTMTGADQEALPGNVRRAGLIFSAPSTNTGPVFLSFMGTAVAGQGIAINATTAPFVLWGDGIGQGLKEDIRCIGTANDVLNILEIGYG